MTSRCRRCSSTRAYQSDDGGVRAIDNDGLRVQMPATSWLTYSSLSRPRCLLYESSRHKRRQGLSLVAPWKPWARVPRGQGRLNEGVLARRWMTLARSRRGGAGGSSACAFVFCNNMYPLRTIRCNVWASGTHICYI